MSYKILLAKNYFIMVELIIHYKLLQNKVIQKHNSSNIDNKYIIYCTVILTISLLSILFSLYWSFLILDTHCNHTEDIYNVRLEHKDN